MKKVSALFLPLLFLLPIFCFAQERGKTIQIDGKSQRYQLSGIEDRKLGQPLVIFESGLGTNLETWHRVVNELGENIPVFAYDRAGIGQSEAMDETPTPENRTKQLKAILDELQLAPPYILVGQAWGGILIKDFAQTYPQDIEAMVYVDPINRSTSRQSIISLLDNEELDGEKIAAEHFKIKRQQLVNAPEGVKSEGTAILDLAESEISNHNLYDFPEVPSVIFVGGMHVGYMENPFDSMSIDHQKFLNILHKDRIANFTQHILESSDSEMVLISEYANYLNLQAPEKIVSAISSKYFGDPSKKIASAAAKYSPEEFEEYLDGLFTYFPEEKIPESTINMLGYDQLRRDKPEYAIILFKVILSGIPSQQMFMIAWETD